MGMGIIVMNLFLICFATMLLFRILLALCVKKDADSIGVRTQWYWILLAFFIPITVVIYLLMRQSLEKTVPKYCFKCGESSAPNSMVCQHCGSANIADMVSADSKKKKKSVKSCIIAMIVVFIVGAITFLTAFGIGIFNVFSNHSIDDLFGYLDYLDDYDYNFDNNEFFEDEETTTSPAEDEFGNDFEVFDQDGDIYDENYYEYDFDNSKLDEFAQQ